ncbi:hypothetical protein FHS52_003217 [Erythromicrobium ramosum]|uniref:Uncharacterized protein n=1 Tax=Erythrobacter ramosus TaxID=35811 RepID=A0ABR6I367_9SPHN|nr:hypothetical protein [Erythrobacter ramosus]MBB3777220.1 hypothetical protein [Erythrobacter ramosus]
MIVVGDIAARANHDVRANRDTKAGINHCPSIDVCSRTDANSGLGRTASGSEQNDVAIQRHAITKLDVPRVSGPLNAFDAATSANLSASEPHGGNAQS